MIQTSIIVSFLVSLRDNNNKEWFDLHREEYSQARKAFEALTEELINATCRLDSSIGKLSPKDCIFRINRDVRFSHNKDPYKTHFGAFIAPGGKNSINPGYYIHIEPEKTFAGGGLYMPQPIYLKAIRDEIFHNTDEFRNIILDKNFISSFKGISLMGDELKTAPKGYPKDWEDIDLLKFKHYTCGRHFSNKEVMSPDFVNKIITSFQHLKPLNQFLNSAIRNLGAE